MVNEEEKRKIEEYKDNINTKGYEIKLLTKTELKQFLPYIKETTQEGI